MSINNSIAKKPSLVPTLGKEGKDVVPLIYNGQNLAVFTSGGDSQGMNSALRAVIRMGIYVGCRVYVIYEGYQGLVDGGECIRRATWEEVSGIIQLGGTVLGSARCSDFRKFEGRLKAAQNLLNHGITNLVVIGGDGSLTGADCFREEWPKLLDCLLERGAIDEDARNAHSYLNIVGLVGSIDNDFCGTDMTIGTDSALHRIIEATDAITTTAQSHRRCFVLEVMGRNCGYLAMVAAAASEADFVFLPEYPPEKGWEDALCNKLEMNRYHGQRVNIIIVSEGAIDREQNIITSEGVKNLISTRLNMDTRVTVLGHVQRGGAPSAFDRILGIRLGSEAVLALMEATKVANSPAYVIALDGNQCVRIPLRECVAKTRDVAKALKSSNFEEAARLRGKSFNNNLLTYLKLSQLSPPVNTSLNKGILGVMNVGAPAAGINAAMRAFVRMGIAKGYRLVAIPSGFEGFLKDLKNVKDLTWDAVRGWAGKGGSEIGTKRVLPSKLGMTVIAKGFESLQLKGLLIIGGFEGFQAALELYEARKDYSAFRIPIVLIPATISNNVPGTDFSLGADTSLNEIVQITDKIRQSAAGTTGRVFILETMGGRCGYLATMSGLAGGADAAYIFEEYAGIDCIRNDAAHLRNKIETFARRGLILRCEGSCVNFNTDFIYSVFAEEGKNIYDCRKNILGHVQQGDVPTPYDRNMGMKMGSKSLDWMHQFVEKGDECNDKYSVVLNALLTQISQFTPIADIVELADFGNRIPKKQWWLRLRPLLRIMAKHTSVYESLAPVEHVHE